MYSDRLTSHHSVVILLLCAAALLLAPFVFDPVRCYTPPHMTSAQVAMIQASCYGAPWYPMEVESPPSVEGDRFSPQLVYYQWTGVFLALQAVILFLPATIWVGFQRICGINIHGLLAAAGSCRAKDDICRRRHFRGIARIIRSTSRGSIKLMCSYTLVKFIYLLISVGQLIWLNRFLGSRYGVYGPEALHHIRVGTLPTETSTFPRQSLCDVAIRHLANIQRHTVQCVLPLNYVFEGVSILVWFWLLFVATANLASFSNHVITMSVPAWQRSFVATRIAALSETYRGSIDLSKDEYLIIRHLAMKDEILAAEILLALGEDLKPQDTSGCMMEHPSAPPATQQLYPNMCIPGVSS